MGAQRLSPAERQAPQQPEGGSSERVLQELAKLDQLTVTPSELPRLPTGSPVRLSWISLRRL